MSSTSDKFYCIAIELDSGTIFVAGQSAVLGTDIVQPAVLSISQIQDSASFSLEKQALEDYVQNEIWINREAEIIEISHDLSSVYEGNTVLYGIIEDEPQEQDGIIGFILVEHKKKLVTLPGFGEITATEYPNAPDESQGILKPLIIGTVEISELIPVEQRKYTTLSDDITDTDTSIEVDDGTIFSGSGSVTIDGKIYTYTSKTDNMLLGMTITELHRSGTSVSQTGQVQYLAAGHDLTEIKEVKVDEIINGTGVISLPAATVTFPQMPTKKAIYGQENVIAEFDEIDASDTASLSLNAIRAVTATDSNVVATGLPYSLNTGASELTRNGVVDFPAPTQDRIIHGAYSITFSVNHNGNTGNAEVKIGEHVVWALSDGAVVFNDNPATFFYHELTNQLPVSISRNSLTGSIDVTVVIATRTIQLGNLDGSLFGQIADTEQFVANQTTSMPARGVIKKAQLAIEWFGTDDIAGTADVHFDNVLLGQLTADNLAGQTVSENITVDIQTQGSAALLRANVNKAYGGGLSSLSYPTTVFRESFPISYREIGLIATFYRFQLNFTVIAPDNVKSTGNTFTVTYRNGETDDVSKHAGISVKGIVIVATGGDGSQTKTLPSLSPSESLAVQGEILLSTPQSFEEARNRLISNSQIISLSFNWKIDNITQNYTATSLQVAQSVNTPLQNTGITTTHSGGGQDINIEIPAPPRTVINQFTLPAAVQHQWPYFTNKQVKIVYSSAGAEKIALVRAVLLIDYDVIINAPATRVTATITGKSENPADVIQLLADATGQKVGQNELARISKWSVANNYKFSRRLAQKADALQLIYRAAQQVSSLIADREKLVPIRWFDESVDITIIDPDDELSPAIFRIEPEIYNSITLKYRYDGESYTRAIIADKTNNTDCKVSQDEIKEIRSIELQSLFIADDLTASQYLSNYARRYAKRRKTIAINLPFSYSSLKQGQMIQYENVNYKITLFSVDDGWISLTAEEIK